MPDPTRVGLSVLEAPVQLRVHGDDAEHLAAQLRHRWAPCLAEVDPGARGLDIRLSTDPVPFVDRTGGPAPEHDLPVEAADEGTLLQLVTQAVTYQAIAANIGRLLMVHAAGLCHPTTGDAVVCIAPGNTGKTTLCATLGPGRGYLTDETVGLHADGSVVAYPKPLSVRRPGQAHKDETAPGDLGLRPSDVPARARALLMLDRSAAAGDPVEVTALGLLDAVEALAPESSSLGRLPRPLHLLADLMEGLEVMRVRYRECADLEPLVGSLIGGVDR